MKKRKFTAAAIADHIRPAMAFNGKTTATITPARVRAMLANPDKGKNRERLKAALIEMGMTDAGAEMFIGGKQIEK
jgi:hypothetical protein